MTDYTKSTGSTGTMMIRDTGNTVEFWINSGNPTTFDFQLPWAYIVNGVSSSWKQYRYTANSGWQRLGSWTVTSTQTVTFKLDVTGTSGFGGPTTFSHAINRGTVPAAPNKPLLNNVSLNSVDVSWTPNGDGGSTILGYQLGYGTNPSTPVTIISANSPVTINNLAMGTLYYFWVRAQNSVGFSAWSAVGSVRTYTGVFVCVGTEWKIAVPYVKVSGVWKQVQPFVTRMSIDPGFG